MEGRSDDDRSGLMSESPSGQNEDSVEGDDYL